MNKLNVDNNRNIDPKIKVIFSVMLILFICYMPDAYCSGLSGLTTALKNKITDVTNVIDGVAKAGVGIGVLWFIISLIRGEPHYRYAFLLILAGCLLYTASNITQWAVGT
jgi:type IV secretory pathway VirB2 component (pilin)